MNNVKLRIISGSILFAIFLIAIFFMRPIFHLILMMLGMLMCYEWFVMTRKNLWFASCGIILMSIPIISLVIISSNDQSGWLVFGYFLVVWSVDTMAMVFGKMLQGPKLAPQISPHKTISGLVFGVGAGVVTAIILYLVKVQQLLDVGIVEYGFGALILSFMCQVSDLFISIFKRKFNIKDSGAIIPGHGGVLDRFDSIILTAPLLLFLLNL